MAKLLARATQMIAQAVCCTFPGTIFMYFNVNGPPEAVQCNGPWRKLDIIFENQQEPLPTKEANATFGVKGQQDMFFLYSWLSSSALSTCTHTGIHSALYTSLSFNPG